MLKNRYKCYLVVFIVFCMCSTTVVLQPNRFQKWNSFQCIDEYRKPRIIDTARVLEVDKYIKNIPYKNSLEYVYAIYPEVKYNKTILNGYGDCSTMSFGASYYLLKNNIAFELIHFIPKDTLFKSGGHVTLRVPYNYNGKSQVGIIDLAGGGFPSYGGKSLDVFDIKRINKTLDFIRLNDKAPEYYKNYYKLEYLSNVYFGFTPSSEISTYFEFIDKYYSALGSEKLEKLFYDGLAILFGKYYAVYVDSDFISKNYNEILLFRFILYFIRLFLLILPVCLFIELSYLISKRSKIEH